MRLFQFDAGKEWRGGQRQSFFLAKELHKKGYPIAMVVQPQSPLHEKVLEADLPVFPVKMRSEFDLAAVLRITSLLRRKKGVLVHFHDAHSLALGSYAASLAKVPLRVISRRVDFALNKNPLSQKKYKKNVDSIIAVSEGVKRVLIDGGVTAGVIDVVPDGIEFAPVESLKKSDYLRRELSFSSDEYLVGMVAHLVDHKGHKYLVDAARILKEKAPKIKIIIVGEGPLLLELTQQTRNIDVDDIVFFLGFRNDVPKILSSLDLFVLSSHLEGMGSSIMDAMAYKLPVVATHVGGIPEVVVNGKTGILVPPRDPRALAKAILDLYQNPVLASEFGQTGSEVVRQKFSSESMADKILNVYKRVARQKNVSLPEASLAK